MSLPVFFYGAQLPAAGQHVELSGSEARHAVTVQRLGVGEQLVLIDGCGISAEVTITEVMGKEQLWGYVDKITHNALPRPRATVVQALPKSERSELAIDLATQAGVDTIVPWQATRCVAKWSGTKRDKGVAKWQNVALAAAKQSRRAWVPEVRELHSTLQVTELIREFIMVGGAAFLLHEEAGIPFAQQDFDTDEVLFVIGPEGGLTAEEISAFGKAGAQSVRLGPQVLRTASAAMVALAALGALTQRW